MDYQKLLFAAEVRKVAVEIWGFERDNFRKQLSAEIAQEKLKEWDEEHPFSSYIPIALNQLLKVAVHIQETEEMSTNGSVPD